MAWIRQDETVDAFNVTRVMSINPRAMAAVSRLSQAVGHGASALSTVQEEAIATVVSVINRCRY